MAIRPGGTLAKRPLHFIWLLDCSGSMGQDGKIQSLNNAIREAIPHMKAAADSNPGVELLVRAISFSSGASWEIAVATSIDRFVWTDLSAGGTTDMGRAFALVSDQLKVPPMEQRALPPVLALISDGQPTDDYAKGLAAIMAEPWGKRAVRVAIGIGSDAEYGVLEKFIGNPEIPVMKASNPDELTRYIRWVSTAVVKTASSTTDKPTTVIEPPPSSDQSDRSVDLIWG